MSKNSKTTINLEDLKNLKEIKDQMKKAYDESKKEYEEKIAKGEEIPKPSLGQKIIGIIILIVLVVGALAALVLNIDTILTPKNSITITVSDQNGEVVNGLKIAINGTNSIFDVSYEKDSPITETILGVKPGKYNLVFNEIPENYTCSTILDDFTMNEGDKLTLEYECTKNN